MPRTPRLVGGVLLVLAACSDAAAPGSPGSTTAAAVALAGPAGGPGGAGTYRSLGYYTGTPGSYAAIGSFHGSLTMVAADLFDVTMNGAVQGSDAHATLARDAKYGLDTFACLSNYGTNGFSPALGHAAMVTNEAKVIQGALAIARQGYRGLNVDFENLAYSSNVADDRAAYTKFVGDMASALHAAGLEIVISVPAKVADRASDTWTYPYDFAALGPLVDDLQLMTYDQHGPGWSAPGPVAGANWALECDEYAASVVTPSKILIGLPAYGYDWDLTASAPPSYVGRTVRWTDVASLLAEPGAVTHWDRASSSPYVDYTSTDGHQHEAWYEDPRSITVMTSAVPSLGLGGISMWALGDEDAAFWQAAYAGME